MKTNVPEPINAETNKLQKALIVFRNKHDGTPTFRRINILKIQNGIVSFLFHCTMR